MIIEKLYNLHFECTLYDEKPLFTNPLHFPDQSKTWKKNIYKKSLLLSLYLVFGKHQSNTKYRTIKRLF